MTDATLDGFRTIAEAMRGGESDDWQWNGQFMSQQMYGITEARAKAYAAKHGGTAKKIGS